MEFWKMNGAGNDFIVVDDRQDPIPDEKWPEIIRTVCERHMSIGADGFMVVKKPTYGGDYKMLFFNSDGSMGEMCGNGARPMPARCLAASPPDARLRPANPARGARSGPAYRFYPPRNTNPRAVAFLLWNFSYFCP